MFGIEWNHSFPYLKLNTQRNSYQTAEPTEGSCLSGTQVFSRAKQFKEGRRSIVERSIEFWKTTFNWAKLSARSVPRLLRVEQKIRRKECSQENLQMIHDEGEGDFWARFIATDERWLPLVSVFSLLTPKKGSKQWRTKGATQPLKAKIAPMQRKILITAF